jgi:hypothetical protein
MVEMLRENCQLQKLAFKIVNSSTVLLPAWKAMLKAMELAEALLLRDVRTRWNSTYLMLDFAVCHGEVLDRLTGGRENNLRELELSTQEWRLAVQLRNVLKASQPSL